jgi:hypothetical protein
MLGHCRAPFQTNRQGASRAGGGGRDLRPPGTFHLRGGCLEFMNAQGNVQPCSTRVGKKCASLLFDLFEIGDDSSHAGLDVPRCRNQVEELALSDPL